MGAISYSWEVSCQQMRSPSIAIAMEARITVSAAAPDGTAYLEFVAE